MDQRIRTEVTKRGERRDAGVHTGGPVPRGTEGEWVGLPPHLLCLLCWLRGSAGLDPQHHTSGGAAFRVEFGPPPTGGSWGSSHQLCSSQRGLLRPADPEPSPRLQHGARQEWSEQRVCLRGLHTWRTSTSRV